MDGALICVPNFSPRHKSKCCDLKKKKIKMIIIKQSDFCMIYVEMSSSLTAGMISTFFYPSRIVLTIEKSIKGIFVLVIFSSSGHSQKRQDPSGFSRHCCSTHNRNAYHNSSFEM